MWCHGVHLMAASRAFVQQPIDKQTLPQLLRVKFWAVIQSPLGKARHPRQLILLGLVAGHDLLLDLFPHFFFHAFRNGKQPKAKLTAAFGMRAINFLVKKFGLVLKQFLAKGTRVFCRHAPENTPNRRNKSKNKNKKTHNKTQQQKTTRIKQNAYPNSHRHVEQV